MNAAILDPLNDQYPATWEDYVGQPLAKRMLRTAIQSAQMRQARLGHTLLASGQPGIGKTALAMLTVRQLGTQMKALGGRVTDTQARIALGELQDGDVLLLDEIHRMVAGGKRHAEWLLHLLADGVIIGPVGPERQPDVTVIATTTDVGALPETIVSRFQLRPVLHRYDEGEALEIAFRMAVRILTSLPYPSMDTFKAIVRAANRNPRTIRALLEAVRDVAIVHGQQGEDYDITEALTWLGLTPDGLTELALRYLRTLVEEFGGTAGGKSMIEALQEPGGLDATERLLMDKGLIHKTRRGRVVTSRGIRRVRSA